MVGISYSKGGVLCKHYKNAITSQKWNNNKKCNATGFGKQHQSKFQTNANGWFPTTKFKTGMKSFTTTLTRPEPHRELFESCCEKTDEAGT